MWATEHWRDVLSGEGETISEIKIKVVIFLEHISASLLFVLTVRPLIHLPKKKKKKCAGCQTQKKVKYIKISAKNKNERESLYKLYDIGM